MQSLFTSARLILPRIGLRGLLRRARRKPMRAFRGDERTLIARPLGSSAPDGIMGGMARKGTWVIVGGAAAFVVTPLAVMAGSLTDDPVIPGSGVVVSGPRAASTTGQASDDEGASAEVAGAESSDPSTAASAGQLAPAQILAGGTSTPALPAPTTSRNVETTGDGSSEATEPPADGGTVDQPTDERSVSAASPQSPDDDDSPDPTATVSRPTPADAD